MDQHQQRRLATFVVNRENMHNGGSSGLRCLLAHHHLASNGTFVIEVHWHLKGVPDLRPEPYMFIAPEEVESLRGVWMSGADTVGAAPPTRTPSTGLS